MGLDAPRGSAVLVPCVAGRWSSLILLVEQAERSIGPNSGLAEPQKFVCCRTRSHKSTLTVTVRGRIRKRSDRTQDQETSKYILVCGNSLRLFWSLVPRTPIRPGGLVVKICGLVVSGQFQWPVVKTLVTRSLAVNQSLNCQLEL